MSTADDKAEVDAEAVMRSLRAVIGGNGRVVAAARESAAARLLLIAARQGLEGGPSTPGATGLGTSPAHDGGSG